MRAKIASGVASRSTTTFPSNIAARLLKPGRVEGVSGVNLPMLIRALNYREEPGSVSELAEKAISGASEGVVRMEAPR